MKKALSYVLIQLWWLHLIMLAIYGYSILSTRADGNTAKLETLYDRWWGIPAYISALAICYMILDKFGDKSKL